MEARVITMEELETIMTAKKEKFDASSIDTYGFSVDMLCTGCHFDKTMDGKDYISMALLNEPAEIDIDPSIIEKISVDKDGTITLTFDGGAYLPDLEKDYGIMPKRSVKDRQYRMATYVLMMASQ